jgi:beta-galactosidase
MRERLLMDFGWRFHPGHAADPSKDFGYGAMDRELLFAKSGDFPPVTQLDFDDSAWRAVDLPHDWAVELPFKDTPELADHGGKPLGRNYPETSVGWYRRVFTLAASDAEKRISVEFDGVFRNATVTLNGYFLGENLSGYAPFRFDVNDFANFGGKNVLTLRADATLGEGWFYEGAGIYRHVWLTKTGPLHLTPDGVFVRSRLQQDTAFVSISTEIQNETEKEKLCRVLARIINAEGREVASVSTKPRRMVAGEEFTFELQTTMDHPQLWSLEEPHLYKVITSVEADNVLADQAETAFGIREIHFDAEKGFFLNGKPVKIKGTCNHQDHAGVGAALPDRLHYYRIERLKEMGSNAYRTAHNPPAPELLDACDRLGMLVMDETRMMSSNGEGMSQLERMIRRDRNHPSIVIWSLGNEEWEQGRPRGAHIVASMKRLVRQLDPTRPVTLAMNGGWGKGASNVVDVQGFNYAGGGGKGGAQTAENMESFHRQFPNLPTIGSETASEYSTRGIYKNDAAKGYVSAYDVNFPKYTLSSEGWWKIFAEREFLAGGFAWTGFDYRGEPSPYSWPCISSHFGAMDTCGFPKDNYFYYQAWWGSKPVLHLFPHWNWEGKDGQPIEVWCHTNLDQVELFLNGHSLGTKIVEKHGHVQWTVSYSPGVLKAQGSRNGHVILTDERATTGAPAGIALHLDRPAIAADGEDLCVISVEVVDARGRVVPVASNQVRFDIAGPGRLIGVGNGDPSCHEPDNPSSFNQATRSAFNGLCMALVQALKQPGTIRVSASADRLETASIAIETKAALLRPAIP